MSEMPPPSMPAPAAPAPAKRSLPTWAIVIGVVALLCICVGCVGVFLVANSPMGTGAMAGGQLTFICLEKTNDSNRCSEWAQQVVNTREFNTCVADLLTDNNLTGEALYACLDDKGVGP